MVMVRKLISEFVGTMLLVLFGCGTAVAVNTYVFSIYNISLPFTMLIIATSFGLVLTAIVSLFGKISGAHVNPAVSIAMAIDKRISIIECVEYVIVQILGGIVGAEILGIIFGSYASLGANGYGTLSALGETTTLATAIIVEVLLTFTFVLVVLAVSAKKDKGTNGIILGLTLTLVHVFGIPFTGTSVNPARSIGPAIFTRGDSLSQLWVFIVAPIVGAILAALFFKFVIKEKEINEFDFKVTNRKLRTAEKTITALPAVKQAAEAKPIKKEVKKAPAKKAAPKKETVKKEPAKKAAPKKTVKKDK
jgi:aquaporin Z